MRRATALAVVTYPARARSSSAAFAPSGVSPRAGSALSAWLIVDWHPADGLDPELILVLVDEADHLDERAAAAALRIESSCAVLDLGLPTLRRVGRAQWSPAWPSARRWHFPPGAPRSSPRPVSYTHLR